MKGDFTRLTFNPDKHYRGVLMQQGRVQLDADWNEQVQIAEQRYSTFFNDFVGPSGAPHEDPLLLTLHEDGSALVGSGRYYVNGLLVENKGEKSVPTIPNGNGFYLYYLEVWSREVTAAEDPDLREQALGGPDTTVRLKTEWRVRWQFVGNSATPKYVWQYPECTGQMAIQSTVVDISDNRLYRVEIHDSQSGAIRYKWSRDNGSVVAPASTVDDKLITLADISPSVVNAFSNADFIEVCEGECLGGCAPGYLVKVDVAHSDLPSGKIAVLEWIDGKKTNGILAATADNPILIRRWDGTGTRSGSNFAAYVELENGLKVSFTTGNYYSGDYWLVLVRSGEIKDWEKRKPKPADGITKSFAPVYLARMVNGNIAKRTDGSDEVDDLRVTFQPLTYGSVSKQGDVITGDLCIDGKLGVGFQKADNLRSPLSVRHFADGSLFDTYNSQGALSWRIGQKDADNAGHPGYLSFTDINGKGLTIQEGGNVGIGTTMPECELHIEKATNQELNLMLKNTQDPITRTFITAIPGKSLIQTDRDFAISTNGRGWSDKLTVSNHGNVGIGTIDKSPEEKLVIQSDRDSREVSLLFRTQDRSGDTGGLFYDAIKLTAGWPDNSTAWGQQKLVFSGTTGSSVWNEILTIRANGNVGINGALEIQTNLHVINNINLEQNLFWPGDNPSNKYMYLGGFLIKWGIVDQQFPTIIIAGTTINVDFNTSGGATGPKFMDPPFVFVCSDINSISYSVNMIETTKDKFQVISIGSGNNIKFSWLAIGEKA